MKKITHRFFKIAGKDKTTKFSGMILCFWVFIALLPLVFSKLSNIPIHLQERLQDPSLNYLFGVDGNGQSVGLLIMNGASTSLIVSLITVSMCLVVGIPLGAIAGFFGGKIDTLISRFIDILLAFPPMVLPIAIMAFFGGGLINVVIALSIT
ncbi:MAG: hypothetical protein K2X69_12655, partial [Silvanigrellaceae bacterium]|nr:hypothetical protein [Silvanigrellaceae bacterium]